jgi:DNA-binding Lrp family transcriptional regulator
LWKTSERILILNLTGFLPLVIYYEILKVRRWSMRKTHTIIGVISGIDWGASYHQPWRVKYALMKFKEMGVDLIILAGCLVDMDAINAQIKNILSENKKRDPYEIASEMAELCAEELAEELEPIESNGRIVKIWIVTSPYYEDNKDKYGFLSGLKLKLGSKIKERYRLLKENIVWSRPRINIQDDVGIPYIDVITPKTAPPFRSQYPSTPIESAIRYHQTSSLEEPAPLYIVGGYGVFIVEPNPRSIITKSGYISVPSLHLKEKAGTILQNTLGFSRIELTKEEPQIRTTCFFMDWAPHMERAVSSAIYGELFGKKSREVKVIESVLGFVGTTITIGKVVGDTGLKTEEVITAISEIEKRLNIQILKGNQILGKQLIRKITFEDIEKYGYLPRNEKEISALATACWHIGSKFTDYDLLYRIPRIVKQEKAKRVFVVGDLVEGVKYQQVLKGEVEKGLETHRKQEERVAKIINDLAKQSECKFIVIPGNHDVWILDEVIKTREILMRMLNTIRETRIDISELPPEDRRSVMKIKRLTNELESEIEKLMNNPVEPLPFFRQLIDKKRVMVLPNPAVWQGIGIRPFHVLLKHPHQASSKTSVSKLMNALGWSIKSGKGAKLIIIGNYHEINAFTIRIGDESYLMIQAGTLKKENPFEELRDKVPEKGIVAFSVNFWRKRLVKASIAFYPSFFFG